MLPSADHSARRERVRALSDALSSPGAFRRWYEDAVGSVYGYLYGRCGGDEALAEVLTQQTFIQALERRRTYEGRSSVTTWLCTIARNKLTDHYRRLDRERRRHLRLVTHAPPRDDEWRLASVDDREEVMAALRSLPSLQRAAVILCYVDGLSVREAAEVLRRTESATKSLLGRARERLRAELELTDA
jgi:RNA polymerase sigma-70 factor (ECF subfamily)